MFLASTSFAVELEENQLSTEYYLSYDLDNQRILHSNNIDEYISPASITKLMTALLLYENSKLSDKSFFMIINFFIVIASLRLVYLGFVDL